MNRKNLMFAAATALCLSSCTVKVGEVEAPSNPLETLDGVWATECMEDGDGSFIKSFEMADGNLTIATMRFDETRSCEPAKHSTTVMYSGPLTVAGNSVKIDGAKDYEWEIQMVVGIPYNQTLVDELNSSSACGSNAWAIGNAEILLGCVVTPDFDLSQIVYGTKHYGSYYIQQNVTPPYMHFESKCEEAGYDFICPTADKRPSTTDGTVYFKQ